METTTPKPAANVGTLSLAKPFGAAPVGSTQAATRVEGTVDSKAQVATVDSRTPGASRFPVRARDAGSEGQTNLETKIEDFFSSQDWAESARKEVRKYPIAVVGVALVAGLLIGRL